MPNQYMDRAEYDLSHFLWKAEVHRFSRLEVEQGWNEVKVKIIQSCPQKPTNKGCCEECESLISHWESKILLLKHSTS